jgi:GAF domain-containing protein
VRKRLAIAGHSDEGLALIPLLEANPDVEVCAIVSDDREAVLRGLRRTEAGLAERFAERIGDDVEAVLRTPGLVALVDAGPPPALRRALDVATDRGVQVATPLIAKLLFAFGPVDAVRKPDLLQTLGEILESYNLTVDRAGLLTRILQIAVGSSGAERGSLMLYDREAGELRVEVALGIETELISKIRLRPGEGVSGRAFQERRAVLLRGKADPRQFDIARERGDIACAIAAPLLYDGECLGVLNVSHGRDREAFGSEELEFVEQLARLDAKIIARAEQYHDLVRESGRLRMEAEIRRVLAGSEPLPERLGEICRWMAAELGGGICQVYLVDPHSGALVLQATSGRRDPLAAPTVVRPDEGLVGFAARSRERVLLRDRTAGAELCAAALPLVAADALQGALTFEGAWSDEAPQVLDERLSAAAGALSDELSDALRELRFTQRTTKLAAITEVAARMSASADLAELYRTITTSAAMVLEAEHAILRIPDEESGRFQIRSYFGSADTEAQAPLFELETKLAARATELRGPLQIPDLDQQPEYSGHGTGLLSAMVDPLRHQGRVIATLSVLGRTARELLGSETFGEEDLELLSRFAEHAARALVFVSDRERARHNQRFDDLTGLPNASQLRQRLEEEIARSAGRGRPFALVYLRVAGLAERLEAQTGTETDELVVALAHELRGVLRDFDVLARTAPDTFEMLLPEPDADIHSLLGPLARRVRETTQRPGEEEAAEALGLEFGYAVYPDEARGATALLEKAREVRIRSV